MSSLEICFECKKLSCRLGYALGTTCVVKLVAIASPFFVYNALARPFIAIIAPLCLEIIPHLLFEVKVEEFLHDAEYFIRIAQQVFATIGCTGSIVGRYTQRGRRAQFEIEKPELATCFPAALFLVQVMLE